MKAFLYSRPTAQQRSSNFCNFILNTDILQVIEGRSICDWSALQMRTSAIWKEINNRMKTIIYLPVMWQLILSQSRCFADNFCSCSFYFELAANCYLGIADVAEMGHPRHPVATFHTHRCWFGIAAAATSGSGAEQEWPFIIHLKCLHTAARHDDGPQSHL